MTPTSLCTALAVATLLVTLSDSLSAWLDFSRGRYIILTALTLALATSVPKLREWCTGGFELGVVLSFVFFGSIAAGADVVAMLVRRIAVLAMPTPHFVSGGIRRTGALHTRNLQTALQDRT